MDMVMLKILAPPPHPSPPPIPVVPLTSNPETDIKDSISSNIFLIIMILPVFSFLAGLVLVLSREVSHLWRPTDRNPDDRDNAAGLQGHLQQLSHLHVFGVDQRFIDSLPAFLYKAIIGLRDPFDCAVCLSGFEADDKLRLLPKCGHAFHLACIDAWLLCHSTCPLCRKDLLPDFSTSGGSSPACFVLESLGESSMEVAPSRVDPVLNVPMDFPGEDAIGTCGRKCSPKPWETGDKEDMGSAISEERMVPVNLGKFKSMDFLAGGGEGSSSGIHNLNERRCLSMGSYKYVVDENSLLQVAIRLPKQKSCITKPGHRLAMSEGDCHLTSERFKDFDSPSQSEPGGHGGSAGTSADAQKKESFSFPTILQKKIAEDYSRRASSFELPLYRASAESKRRCDDSLSTSEFDIPGWEKRESEMGLDVEVGSCDNS